MDRPDEAGPSMESGRVSSRLLAVFRRSDAGRWSPAHSPAPDDHSGGGPPAEWPPMCLSLSDAFWAWGGVRLFWFGSALLVIKAKLVYI